MNCPDCHYSPTPLNNHLIRKYMKLAWSQHPLNPIKVTAQAVDRENWATAGTRHLANHPPEEKKNKPA